MCCESSFSCLLCVVHTLTWCCYLHYCRKMWLYSRSRFMPSQSIWWRKLFLPIRWCENRLAKYTPCHWCVSSIRDPSETYEFIFHMVCLYVHTLRLKLVQLKFLIQYKFTEQSAKENPTGEYVSAMKNPLFSMWECPGFRSSPNFRCPLQRTSLILELCMYMTICAFKTLLCSPIIVWSCWLKLQGKQLLK